MNKAKIRLGPLAFLLAVISICLVILAVLSISTALADLRLSEQYADTVTAKYALEAQAQNWLAGLNDYISDGGNAGDYHGIIKNEDGSLGASFTDGTYTLLIGLQETEDGCLAGSWKSYKEWDGDSTLDVYQGNGLSK